MSTQRYSVCAAWINANLMYGSTSDFLIKSEVYAEYVGFCQISQEEPIPYPDFSKIVKSVFPLIRDMLGFQ